MNRKFGSHKLVVIDEAQRITNIGLTLKCIVDYLPEIHIIVTGSSALEIADKIKEPLTGRKYEYTLYPLSFQEMVTHTNLIEEKRLLPHRLIYGYYPEIVTSPGEEKTVLKLLTESYLYKDILSQYEIKKPVILEKLVQALALQIGNEVNYNELGKLIRCDNETIERYIDLLEKAFVIIRLPSLNRNMRNEIKKGRKIYFFDNGIRNAVINNFSPVSLRTDSGVLWENFMVTERIKKMHYAERYANHYFWRTHVQQEIDYIEEEDGLFSAYEFKFGNRKKAAIPKNFSAAYPIHTMNIISPDNVEQFLIQD